jgi:hypothetical protein
MVLPRRVFIAGQKCGVFGVIKRELKRRSAIEPIIGHRKTDSHLGRCHLKGREGDAAKRHPVRHRLQPTPRPRLANDFVAPDPARLKASIRHRFARQFDFLTDDD